LWRMVVGWWEMFVCWFGVGGKAVLVNRIHKSHGILICKRFLLRKCQSGGGLGQFANQLVN